MTDKIKDNTRLVMVVTVAAFAVAVAVYFCPVALPHKIVIPVTILAFGAAVNRQWWGALAFLLSAVGDLMGSFHIFILQLSFFALAHVSFIVLFLRTARRRGVHARGERRVNDVTLFLAAMMLCFAVTCIISHAPGVMLKCATFIYCLLILTMLYTAVQTRRTLFILGAILFVISDTILAWNKFTSPVVHAGLCIMTTYYAAQLLISLPLLASPHHFCCFRSPHV